MENVNYSELMGQRHTGILTDEDRQKLREAVVCVAGTGGAGGWTCVALARLGVQHFKVADPQTYDATNANRQAGCDSTTVGRNKAEVVATEILKVQPTATVEVFPEGVTMDNLERFLEAGSVVVDGVDLEHGALKIKRALYLAAYEKGLFVFSSPVLEFGTAMGIFDPGRSPGFDEYIGPVPEAPKTLEFRKYVKRIGTAFFGYRPWVDWGWFMKQVDDGRAPSVAPACMLSGALVATAIVDHLRGQSHFPVVPTTLHINLRQMTIKKVGPARRWVVRNIVGPIMIRDEKATAEDG